MSKPTSRPAHCAKYLVLLGAPMAPRALLFGSDHRYLAEVVDDDGLTLDDLRRASRACPPPAALTLTDVANVTEERAAVLCYQLD